MHVVGDWNPIRRIGTLGGNSMSLENWVISLSKYKEVMLKITDRLLAHVNLELIEDGDRIVGAKVVWVGERGETDLKVNAKSWKANIKIEGDTTPTAEYWQNADRRGFALRNPKSISFEVDQQTLSRLSTPKAAGIAAIAGAAAGLLGWGLLALANRATLVKQASEHPAPRLIESQPTSIDRDMNL